MARPVIKPQTTGTAVRSLKSLTNKLSKSNPIYQHLAFDSADMVHNFDDFTCDAIDTNYYNVANNSGTNASNFAVVLAAGGTIAGAPGTDDNSSVSLVGPIIWQGDKNCGVEMRLKFEQVTAIHWEMGFIEAVPGSNTGAVNDIDTPTVYGANFAVLAMDTDQTLKTTAIVTEGTTSGQDPAKTNCGTWAPTADTFFTASVQIIGNDVFATINGTEYQAAYDAQGNVEGGTLEGIWLYVQNRGTASTICTVDYIRTWQER